MKLLLDEMYSAVIAEQLRARGWDAASVHDAAYRILEGAPDEDVWAVAVAESRHLVTENVADFQRIEAVALAGGDQLAGLILTTDRQFPRGDPRTVGRIILALDAVLQQPGTTSSMMFLKPAPSR